MANFTTHLTVVAVVSTAMTTFGLMSGLFGLGVAVFCWASGVIGGLLPDIDLETSTPAKRFFSLISLFIATLTAILYTSYYASYQGGSELAKQSLVVWVVAFLVVRYGMIGLFSHLTVHRGMVHSVPYMAMCGLLAVYGAFYGFGMTAKASWLFGGFLFVGAMVHLLLDEIYSVNVLGLKLKKSSGTAFKFFERKKSIYYLILYAMIAILFWHAPDYYSAINDIKRVVAKF